MRTLLFLLVTVTACAKKPPPPGKVVTVAGACDEKSGTEVQVTGWFRFPRTMMAFCSSYGGKKTCDMYLYPDEAPPPERNLLAQQKDERPRIKLSVPVGDDPGEMDELPKTYSDKDVVLHLAKNRKGGEGSKVTIHGKMTIVDPVGPQAEKACWLDVTWAADQ